MLVWGNTLYLFIDQVKHFCLMHYDEVQKWAALSPSLGYVIFVFSNGHKTNQLNLNKCQCLIVNLIWL